MTSACSDPSSEDGPDAAAPAADSSLSDHPQDTGKFSDGASGKGGTGGDGGAGGQTSTGGSAGTAGASMDGGIGGSGGTPSGLSHGSELTHSMVGPEGLGVAISQLRPTPTHGERISTWPTDGVPSWMPNAPYVYNNDPGNHGGIVPSGGLVMDGISIPEGTWVVQFNDFGNEAIIISGNNDGTSPELPGVVFRGCRWRGALTAPGYLNVYANSHTNVWIHYCDAGGLGPADAQYNEIPFKLSDETSNSTYLRNYISYTTTAIQPGSMRDRIS